MVTWSYSHVVTWSRGHELDLSFADGQRSTVMTDELAVAVEERLRIKAVRLNGRGVGSTGVTTKAGSQLLRPPGELAGIRCKKMLCSMGCR